MSLQRNKVNYIKLLVYIRDSKSKRRKISEGSLKDLGYVYTERRLTIDIGGESEYFITEVADKDTKKPASFCYLYNVKSSEGFILDNTYDHYLTYLG